jgi:hypothetical protein
VPTVPFSSMKSTAIVSNIFSSHAVRARHNALISRECGRFASSSLRADQKLSVPMVFVFVRFASSAGLNASFVAAQPVERAGWQVGQADKRPRDIVEWICGLHGRWWARIKSAAPGLVVILLHVLLRCETAPPRCGLAPRM